MWRRYPYPTLTIETAVPEPVGIALLAMIALPLMRRRGFARW